jgi:FKBP-type peptidyl-prolyl cis-trans isomerase 2
MSFVTLPGGAPHCQQSDFADSYLLKHGNGWLIAGLDKGIHTMRVGGKRWLLIPPMLRYV